MQRKYLLPAALFTLILALSHVRADWINLTGAETAPNIAEITVFDDRVEVALEVYVGDLETFEELVPDDWLKDPDGERPALEERLRRFSEQGLRSSPTPARRSRPSCAWSSRACARTASRPSPA